MKYIYGPVKSRRLGLSLGLSITPYKVCSFDCIYCQLNNTNRLTLDRKEYIPADHIITELKSWLKNNPEEASKLDYITFSGSGEPTLNSKIGFLISEIRKLSPAKIALITNSLLLKDASVRAEILGVDLIVPSLDAVTQKIFERIDRPYPGINIEEVINGLIALRKEFNGKIWLEIMLVSGVNDDLRHIKKIKEVVELINPDKVQLNSPVRAPKDSCISVVGNRKLLKIKKILGEKCEII